MPRVLVHIRRGVSEEQLTNTFRQALNAIECQQIHLHVSHFEILIRGGGSPQKSIVMDADIFVCVYHCFRTFLRLHVLQLLQFMCEKADVWLLSLGDEAFSSNNNQVYMGFMPEDLWLKWSVDSVVEYFSFTAVLENIWLVTMQRTKLIHLIHCCLDVVWAVDRVSGRSNISDARFCLLGVASSFWSRTIYLFYWNIGNRKVQFVNL